MAKGAVRVWVAGYGFAVGRFWGWMPRGKPSCVSPWEGGCGCFLLLAVVSFAGDQDVLNGGRRRRSLLGALFSGMRPLQAPKNGLVLVPLVFSVNIWFAVDDFSGMLEIVMRGVGAAVAFTLLSGAVYLVNDLADVERDRSASGEEE